MANSKFNARIAVVFKKNQFKSSVITDYFPPKLFYLVHDWETCKIDGCLNCCYETLPNVDPTLVLLYLIDFVNSVLANHAKEESEERVKVTRKFLAGNSMITFELADYCRVVFNIDHTFDNDVDKMSAKDVLLTSEK